MHDSPDKKDVEDGSDAMFEAWKDGNASGLDLSVHCGAVPCVAIGLMQGHKDENL